ncbi:transposable element Tc1 transposase [Trichonephila clavipes]|uniref:Transposable element Tc1 transposase n=1 Tax=Trichonephila clavipes TaxID=2585209 RepID=A0A8X7BFM5_TRICX|nr:transposable element Tc1 transposase [Trichonephila clavipes]
MPNAHAELWTALANIRQVIPVIRFQKLVESMPRRVAAVFKARGGSTRYQKDLARMCVSTENDCWEQWLRNGAVSRRPDSGCPVGTTETEDRSIRRSAVVHHTASGAEIRAAVGTTVTQRTVITRFYLGASDGHVFARRRQKKRLQPNSIRPTPGVMVWRAISWSSRSTHVVIPNILTVNLFVSLVIQAIILPFLSSTQQQDNARHVTQRVLQC